MKEVKDETNFKKSNTVHIKSGAGFILGKKIEMSQLFNEDKKVVPITLIEAGPCFITQIKTKKPRKTPSGQRGKKDGYEAIQIGFEKLKEKKVKKSQKNTPYRYTKEFRNVIDDKLKVGDKIDVSVFKKGDRVKVSGISKGKGFQGAVKRWGFSGRNATHGVKHEHRTLGSVGASGPQRVFKGKKMPGHMGAERITVENLEIIKIDKENNLIAVKGAVPGHRDSVLEIRKIA